MAALDLSKLVKERRFWVASFLVAWAAALQVPVLPPLLLLPIDSSIRSPTQLHEFRRGFTEMLRLQGHMMWVQRQDAFKDKFGDADAPNKVTEQPPPNGDLTGEQEKATADAEFR
jgi:hypothetical protein